MQSYANFGMIIYAPTYTIQHYTGGSVYLPTPY